MMLSIAKSDKRQGTASAVAKSGPNKFVIPTPEVRSCAPQGGGTCFSLRQRAANSRFSQAGMTLLELIIACSILMILSSAALPIARYSIVHKKEELLRYNLRQIRDAIDRYKDLADSNKIRVEVGSEGYPPDLETLVNGVKLGAGDDKKIRFLRRIPVDPMTGRAEWGLRAVQDDPDSTSWGGKNVFDVYSKSQGTASDGTRYSDSKFW
jgi:general secretion pathway protein G